MLYAISWFLVLTLLAIWSASVWLAHSFAIWSLTGLGALVGHTQPIERLPLPGWISLWAPSELILAFKSLAATVYPFVESVLSALPSPALWLTPLAWATWGIGLVILLAGAAAMHALITMMRRGKAQ